MPPEPNWFNSSDTRAEDRAAIRCALAMTAALIIFTVVVVIVVDGLFPPSPDAPAPWAAQPMPLI